ncbi:MAG: hypothetical protein Ct9H300mP11_27240 [Chloroflexota bacterium]|nr:MAG: hypothetical protein Ct9H300mP11_27240 [Chloroflexota bacterium]
MPIQPEEERKYIQLALNQSEMLCSEAPLEILEAWPRKLNQPSLWKIFLPRDIPNGPLENRGHRLPQEIINNAILVLWLRACRLHTSILLEEKDPDWKKPFFFLIQDYTENFSFIPNS